MQCPVYAWISAAFAKHSRRVPQAAINRGTNASPAPGNESKSAKSGWALVSFSICSSHRLMSSFRLWITGTVAWTNEDAAFDYSLVEMPEVFPK